MLNESYINKSFKIMGESYKVRCNPYTDAIELVGSKVDIMMSRGVTQNTYDSYLPVCILRLMLKKMGGKIKKDNIDSLAIELERTFDMNIIEE